jgi:UDP-glucose-4-epimerase GalE
MTILVTGGAGYIGSHTVRLLRERGREVVALDTMEFGHRAAVGDVALVEADIADVGAVRRAVDQFGVDVVVHFGAYKSPGESMLRPDRYFDNNVAKSARLLQTLNEAGVQRFVFSSSCAVYGTPDAVPVAETAALKPESPYGESKAMTETMLSWYDRCAGLRSVSLRYFNAAGAWPDGSIGEDWTVTINLVPLVMKAALARSGPLKVFGADYPTADGSAIRDYVHVVDLADAHVKAVEYLEAGGESTVCNLGTGVGTSVFEILAAAERVIGRPIPHEVTGRRAGDPVALFADNRRPKELLHWTPDRALDEILGSAWAWHSTHLDGYDD